MTEDAEKKEEEAVFVMTKEFAKAEAYELVSEMEPEALEPKERHNTDFNRAGMTKRTVLEMAEALIFKRGNLTHAAMMLGISRNTLYSNIVEHPALRKARESGREIMVDIWEGVLDEKILDKDTISTIFGLKTQGKKRGYIENQVVYNRIDVTVLTGDQLQRLAAGEEPAAVLGEAELRKALKAPEEVIDAVAEDV